VPELASPGSVTKGTIRHDVIAVEDRGLINDMIIGWEYCATLDLETPLVALEMDGVTQPGVEPPAQIPGTSARDGVWLPVTKSFCDLGVDLPEVPPGERASPIGPVPKDGGDLRRFLIEYRRIEECTASLPERAAAMEQLTHDPQWERVCLCGKITATEYTEDVHYDELRESLGLSERLMDRLWDANYRTEAAIRAVSDSELLAVRGIGSKSVLAIRRCIQAPRD
jgi:hypothetical protein